MPPDAAIAVGVIGLLLAFAGLAPFLRAADHRAKLADMLTTAQGQKIRIDDLLSQRDDLAARVAELEQRVDALDRVNKHLDEIIERAIRHGRHEQ